MRKLVMYHSSSSIQSPYIVEISSAGPFQLASTFICFWLFEDDEYVLLCLKVVLELSPSETNMVDAYDEPTSGTLFGAALAVCLLSLGTPLPAVILTSASLRAPVYICSSTKEAKHHTSDSLGIEISFTNTIVRQEEENTMKPKDKDMDETIQLISLHLSVFV